MTHDTSASPSAYTCNEYREEMMLMGLLRRLQDPDITDKERKKLTEEIAYLKKKTGLE